MKMSLVTSAATKPKKFVSLCRGCSDIGWNDEPQPGVGNARRKSANPTFARNSVAVKIDSQTLSLFADGMATCLSAGLPPQRALELNRFEKQSKALGKLVDLARQRCGQGMPLSEALEPGRKFLPHYFLPVLRAGEAGGRLVEAFQLLSRQSRRIGPSVRLVRNTWLYPLILVCFGWVVRIVFFCISARPPSPGISFWAVLVPARCWFWPAGFC